MKKKRTLLTIDWRSLLRSFDTTQEGHYMSKLDQEESQTWILLRDLDFFQVDMLGIKESFYVLPVAPATGEDSSTFVNSTMPTAKF